jgi:putative transposon-encoded protein
MKKVGINTKNKLFVENIEGFVKRKVTKFGNSAKVSCPKEYLGKDVYLVIIKDGQNQNEHI